MTPIERALATTLDLLEDHGLPYAISGSFAAAHHGYIRATEDIDIQVTVETQEELDELGRALPPEVRRIDRRTWAFPGEILVELYQTEDELDAVSMQTRVEGPLPLEDERTGWFVDVEPLLVLKIREHVRHGHGHKHLADIEQLIARNHDRLDIDRLETLLALDPAWAKAWDEGIERHP